MLPIEDDAPTTLPAQMCGCGAVWLMPWALGFVAEGREHQRGRCRDLPPP